MLQHFEIILRVDGVESVEEVGLDHNRPTYPDKLYWGLLKFDRNGLFFCYPDMAKYHAIDAQDIEYRSTRAIMDMGSLNGYERALLKTKPKDKKAEAEDKAFWAIFNTWTE